MSAHPFHAIAAVLGAPIAASFRSRDFWRIPRIVLWPWLAAIDEIAADLVMSPVGVSRMPNGSGADSERVHRAQTMPDSREKWPRWRRIAGMLLFDASLVATTLGIARLVFGAGIDVGPGPSISLGPGGPWPPLILAAVLFVAAASLKPGRVRAESADDRALGADGVGAQIGSLGAGPPDLVSPVRDPTPLPRQRTDAGS